MSADNGVYIHKFDYGFKVAELMAVENIWEWDREEDSWNPNLSEEKIKDNFEFFFKDSPIFQTLEDAVAYANQIAKETQILEYGVCTI